MRAGLDAGQQLILDPVQERDRGVEDDVRLKLGERRRCVVADGSADGAEAEHLTDIASHAIRVEVEGTDELEVGAGVSETRAGLTDGAEAELEYAKGHERGNGNGAGKLRPGPHLGQPNLPRPPAALRRRAPSSR